MDGLAQLEARVNRVIFDLDRDRVQLPPVPPLAAIAGRFRESSTGPSAFVKALEQHPRDTDRLLRLVNATRDPAHHLHSLEAAAPHVGPRRMASLVDTVALIDFLRDGTEHGLVHLRKIWTNTLFTALGAREIAKWMGHPDVERVYLSALFHNVGEPLLIRLMAESVGSWDSLAFRTSPLVMEAVKTNHELVGRLLLEAWKLPSGCVELARAHHCALKSEIHAITTAAYQSALTYGYAYLDIAPSHGLMTAAIEYLGLSRIKMDELPHRIGPALNATLSVTAG